MSESRSSSVSLAAVRDDAVGLLAEVRDVVFRVDAEGRWRFLSRAWEGLTGLSPETTLGQRLIDFVHPDDQHQSLACFRTLTQGLREYCPHEVRYRSRDGWRAVEIYARACRDDQGGFSGATGTLRDVSDRHSALQRGLRRAIEVQALQELADRLVRAESQQQILELGLDAAQRVTGAYAAVVLLLDADGVSRVKSARGLLPEVCDALEGPPLSRPGDARQPLVWPGLNPALPPQLERAVVAGGLTSLAFVPLVHDGASVGELVMGFAAPHDFESDELALCDSIATQLTVHLERSRTLTHLRDERRRDAVLKQVLRLAIESFTVDQFLDRSLEAILTAPALALSPRGAIFLSDEQGGLVMRAKRGLPHEAQTCAKLASGQCLCGWVARSGRTLLADSHDVRHVAHGHGPAHCHLIIPILAESRVLGVLALYLPRDRRIEYHEQSFLEVLAQTLAASLERLRAREALERERTLFLTGPVVAFRWANDAARTVEYVSPNVAQFGYTAAALVSGKVRYFELVHPDDLQRVVKEVAGHLARRLLVFRQAYRVVTPAGAVRHVEDFTTALRNQAGEVTSFQGYLVDVTERHDVEAARARSEADFAVLIENSVDAVCAYRRGRIVFVNRAGARFLGCSDASELVGQKILDLVHPQDRAMARERVQQVWEGGQPSPPREVRMLRRDGTEVVAEVAEIRASFGGEQCIVALSRDLSERRQMIARAMQMDRMIAVGTLATGVAHEINNPLAYVLSNVRYVSEELSRLERTAGPEVIGDLGAALADAEKGATRVRDIVRDLKTLARTEEVQAVVALGQVLDSAVSVARSEIQQRARLVQDYAHLPDVMGSAGRLGQVFLNLLVNAAQAIPEGRLDENEITLKGHVDGAFVVVEVRDTGCGIPPGNLRRIFDPFFTTKPVGQGTGLGLSICRGIVKSLGGTLEVSSEPGQGTTFSVRLPRAVAAAEVPVATPMPAPAPEAQVLVVDDDPLVLSSLRRTLGSRYQVTTVSGGEAALQLLHAGRRFEAVLCDLMMPELSGWQFFERVQALDEAQARRIVIMTGGAFTPDARQFLETVPNPRLAKPFDNGELFNTLEPLVRRS